LESDLAGIDGTSKYPEGMTVRPDDLTRGVGFNASRLLHDQRAKLSQNQQISFNEIGYGPASYQLSATRKHIGSTSPKSGYPRAHSNMNHVSQGSLNILAETALATPPTSVQHSGHVYSSEVSSAPATSPEKSLQSDGKKGFQSSQLLESLKSVAKELGIASEHDRERIILALRPVAQELGFGDGMKSKRFARQRGSSQANPGLLHSRPLAMLYDSGQSDGPDGKTDSASEEEDVRKGLAFLASIGANPPNPEDGYNRRSGGYLDDKLRAKSSREVDCPYNCGIVKKRQCDMKYVPTDKLKLVSLANLNSSKHIKRHTKPYACVYPECKKTFGSKVCSN
jgi:hypothetical protein